MTTILVSGCGGPAANNFMDALRLSGEYRFIGVDSNKYMLELSSADEKVLVPPCTSPEYIPMLNQIIASYSVDLLHAQPDIEVEVVSRNRSKINTKTFVPDISIVHSCQRKDICNITLDAFDVPVPRSWTVAQFFLNQLSIFGHHDVLWMRAVAGANSKAALPITNVDQALGWLNYWEDKGLSHTDFMVSEYLPGREYAWQSLWLDGELICSQARERVEYFNAAYSPTGQSSSPSVARTISDPKLDEMGVAAVKAMTSMPEGIFSVDMKEDAQGRACVTEINPGRFFTTSNFFAHAGLNIPEMYVEIALTGKFQDRPGRLDPLPDDLYWLRQVDMNYKLVDGSLWT